MKTFKTQGGINGSVVKNICSSRGPRLSFQNPHGGSQPTITPVPRYQMPYSDFLSHYAHVWYTSKYAEKTLIHTK